ncbi:MAG: hypothetical protein ACI32C_02615 [Candidatus Enteromonas sp.]
MNADVGSVVDFPSYISTPKIEYFEVCPTGLVVDETIVYKGDITLSSSLKVKDGLTIAGFDLAKSVAMKIDLKNTGSFNFFTTSYMSTMASYKFSSTEIGEAEQLTQSSAITIDGSTSSTKISCSDISLNDVDALFFKVAYSFNFEAYKNTFTESIYSILGETPLKFSLHIEVESL